MTFCIGPDDWESVASACGRSKQSPINIVTKQVVFDSRLTPVQFTGYQETVNTVITNNGHTGKLLLNIAYIFTGNIFYPLKTVYHFINNFYHIYFVISSAS